LAAIRPLELVVERLIEKLKFQMDFPILVCNKDGERDVQQTLERLLHNVEDGHFFLRRGSHQNITRDLCVFLTLSVALRIGHFDACVSSKIAELQDVFQAKVGWLTGNLYSRIGTPDLEEHSENPDAEKRAFYDEAVYSRTAWLTAGQRGKLKDIVHRWRNTNRGAQLTREIAVELLGRVPENIDLIAGRVVELLVAGQLMPNEPDLKERALNAVRNDASLQRLIGASAPRR
jgi:hypothetical protein